MSSVNPDSYCGIYCGACSVHMQGETGCPDGFTACLGSLPKSEIACGGCKSGNLYAGCRICNFRDCALKKGITHCVECAEYPCGMYKKWKAAARFLPHVGEAGSSLELIRREGVEVWLAAQKKRWSCPECGSLFSWYADACPGCGRALAGEAYKMKGWRKLLCRIVLPLAYRKAKAKSQG